MRQVSQCGANVESGWLDVVGEADTEVSTHLSSAGLLIAEGVVFEQLLDEAIEALGL